MRKKINLGSTIIILLVWIICLYTIFSSLSVQKLFNELNDDIIPGAISMTKMKYEATDIKLWTLSYILRGNIVRNEKTIKEWLQESWSNLENEAQIHYEHEKHIGIEEQQAAEKIITLSQKLISASTEIINLKDQGVESDILFEKIKEDFRSSFYPLREKLREHIKIHMEELADAQVKAQSKYQANLLYIAILGIIVTLLSIFIGLFINKIFTRYITERNKAEKALKESEERFQAVFETAQDFIFIKDRSHIYRQVNPAMEKLFGVSASEIVGLTDDDLFGKEIGARIRNVDSQVINGEIIQEEDTKPVNGIPRTFHIIKVPIRDSSGEIIGLCGIARDITRRKQIENALKESEEKYRTLTENINIGIYRNTVGAKGKYIEANPAIVEMFGFKSKKEFLSYNVADLYIHPEERKKFSDKMQKEGFVKDEELELKRKDGSFFIASVSAVVVKDKEDNVQFYDGIIEDITRRKRAEEEINRHREQLKLINTILRHDLANNLAVIKSAIRIYKVKKDESILDEASLNVNKSAELIRKMREHENLIAKESLKVFEISEVIKQVMENYPDIEFAIKGKKEIFADDALNSVIDNIFRNAVVHGKTNRIDIKIGTYKDRCFVKIADNGTGVPDKIKEKIFDEGFKYGKKAHTGMGLYIVKKSVERWGGSIFVEDNKPKGAVFVLLLKSMR